MHLLVFGTHPHASNGYAKVMFNLLKRFDGPVDVFAFQNLYPQDTTFAKSRALPPNVKIHDAYEMENPKAEGFGLAHIGTVLDQVKPTHVLVYSDMMLVTLVIGQILAWKGARPIITVYLDQVYPFQKKQNVFFVNNHVDKVIAFSPHWAAVARKLGIFVPVVHVPHGFDPDDHPAVDTKFARSLLGLDPDDFIVLNLNRNQARKRWDTCLAAWAEFVARRRDDTKAKLLIGTEVHGAWDLMAVYEHELAKRGIALEAGLQRIICMERPQRATDAYVTLMLNACDIGINTADGEGFGLCQVEHACVGKPQILPRLGAFTDYFDDSCARLIDPRINYHLDSKRDGVGGEAAIGYFGDYADAIEEYFTQPELRRIHGAKCRDMCSAFDWGAITRDMVREIETADQKSEAAA
jgi:glycosyltransferase involved in cell wall biosynthesis